LQRLAQAAESVADGNYVVQIPDDGFGSELQTLSRSFTRMSHRLEEIDASRTRMLNDLAHEIRTPLATLEVFVDGMEDKVVPIDEQTYVVLHSQITRLRRLAHDVRDAANAGEHALGIDTGPVDLHHQVDLAVELARPQFQAKDVTLASRYSSKVTSLDADEQRLQQVLTNVLSNALRHTPPGGCVTVTVADDGDFVQIQVTDNGQGIPATELDDIFERFYRGDPSRTANGATSGSGLGLTIARAITTEHGGSITASSPGVGQGATITIRLPRAF
jgi:two-component system sensor histidine kinase BaeS